MDIQNKIVNKVGALCNLPHSSDFSLEYSFKQLFQSTHFGDVLQINPVIFYQPAAGAMWRHYLIKRRESQSKNGNSEKAGL